MKLYKNFDISKDHKRSIILIGNFDGVHVGHQKLFKLANDYKKKYNLSIGVLTFEPMPKMFFNNKRKKILSIGDNLNTDIKGANLLNYDSLIISNGIHKDEIEKDGIDKISKQYEAIVNFIQTELKW